MDGNMVIFAFRKENEFDLFDLNKQQAFCEMTSGFWPFFMKEGLRH